MKIKEPSAFGDLSAAEKNPLNPVDPVQKRNKKSNPCNAIGSNWASAVTMTNSRIESKAK
mgnify:CR=1 FL=1